MSDLVSFTYASEDNYHLHRLVTSAAYHGIKMQVLGVGDPWRSLLQKLETVGRSLQELPEDQIVLFVDGYDTIFLQPASVIQDRFLGFGRPTVFSAERCFYAPGNEGLARRYPSSPTPYRYLNSGCYIGYAGPLATLLERVLERRAGYSDQSLLSRYFVDHQGEIALDRGAELFVATSGRPYDDDFVVEDETLLNTETGTRPCVLHTPGKYFGVLEFYSRQLPFYRDVRWSRMSPRILAQIVSGYLNLKAYRALKRRGWVRHEQDYSRLLAPGGRRS